ncbi:hypothetical protein D8B26_005934 [Coccidioides posadasii str. Silveira]|uniref:D-serine dehydratase n=2 Tax=Coccidioides posadasii TaxID=199306 RepID=E9DI98_COCPS|nr:hypothetical protein CPC735_032820 [Coccidioides posadasii C735 delta SOWgp]EER27946.1 hypothetical protein CPC735_032820 [Coccidioides posadasii C735 delta SOWgp]EFW13894.1 conserved hypothetical protein [Coccidioides posadasii str. Silveira]QVM11281.1 hypothetical protein D8B26_005934 [Coccidioides posadasii str. Silveira]|eukprot:XP_003070091.1 hypothetical protein CPC735_032820 [Coccidioides posadasii C735 delta SOWgp]
MSGVQNYPNASTESLKAQYVGRRLQDIDGPAAIIDIAAARQNCQVMLDAAEELGVIFRSHVKTHKTTELTRFQVGEKADTVRLVVSTLAEAEQLRPYLEECKGNGRSIDVIYGLPVQPSNFVRLATLGRDLGELCITVLVDSLHILPFLSRYRELTGNSLGVFFKLDTGYNRAGLTPDSPQFKELLGAIHKVETEMPETIYFRGFYSHMGQSYGSDTTSEALDYLALEIERCEIAALQASNLWKDSKRRFIITVGATPTTTSAQNLTGLETTTSTEKRVKELIKRVRQSFDVELHAGAYVTLDLQQLAAHARPATNNLSFDNLALTVLAEVASLYLHRERPEALIACGSLCMGREPCRSYSGWGVITPWLQNQGDAEMQGGVGWYDPEGDRTGWIIDRLSQEHGILRWQGPVEKMRELRVGEKVRIWPNHCCICAAGFSYFLVVDSTREGVEKDKVIDVWLSWRGW